MSVVYLARDIRLNRNWALKVVRKEGVRDFEVVKQCLNAEIDLLRCIRKNIKKERCSDEKKENRSFVVPTNFVVPPPHAPVVSAKHSVKPLIPTSPTVVPNHCNNETSVLGVPCDDATTLLEMPFDNKTTVFVATTSVSKLEQNTEIEVCFYLVSDDDKDIMNKLTLKDLERDNLIGSKSFFIDEAEEINVDLQSEDILFNRHKLNLSMEKRMDSVRAIKSILRKDEVCPVVHVQIKCKEKIYEEFNIEYKS